MLFKELSISRWFPPNDPIAAAVARLCILREDFYLEGLGLGTEDLSPLDSNGQVWRRLYFMRQAVRTLQEAKGAMMKLNQDRDFQSALKNAGDDFRNAVQHFQKVAGSVDLKEVRNNLGGHVSHSAVERFLNRQNQDIRALAVFGSTHKDTHYNFTSNLVLGIVAEGAPEHDELEKMREIAKVHLGGLMTAVDRILTAYALWRALI